MSPTKKALRKFRKTDFGNQLSTGLISIGIKSLVKTLRLQWIDREPMDHLYAQNQPFIYVYWHCELILATRIGAEEMRRKPIVLMASSSRDGALVTKNMESQGLKVVRGSSGKKGAAAFLAFAKSVRNGMNGSLAVDGPRGPRLVVKDGVIRLCQLTGVPLVPFAVGYRNRMVARSWDRLRIPLPFTSACAVCGDPLFFDKNLSPVEIQQATKSIADRLMDLRTRLPYDTKLE